MPLNSYERISPMFLVYRANFTSTTAAPRPPRTRCSAQSQGSNLRTSIPNPHSPAIIFQPLFFSSRLPYVNRKVFSMKFQLADRTLRIHTLSLDLICTEPADIPEFVQITRTEKAENSSIKIPSSVFRTVFHNKSDKNPHRTGARAFVFHNPGETTIILLPILKLKERS